MASNAINENSLTILNYIIEHEDDDLTAQDIADALGKTAPQVNGAVNGGLIGKGACRGLVERVSGGAVQTDKGVKEIKYIKVTEAGKAYDHEKAIAADIAAKTQA